jgi:hypothetical protein
MARLLVSLRVRSRQYKAATSGSHRGNLEAVKGYAIFRWKMNLYIAPGQGDCNSRQPCKLDDRGRDFQQSFAGVKNQI